MGVEPNPNWVTKAFWEAAGQRSLIYPCCDRCDNRFFPPRPACPKCLSLQWSWKDSAGKGTIYSAVTVHKAPIPDMATPYVLAIVTLDEGVHMLANIVGCRPAAAQIGQRVAVNWDTCARGYTVPNFELSADLS
ncbi:Zn-ribbon domain-containing OB-fold protein [Chelatococcus reniformis]|nr:OB-fold domain-containing protein [Chelatococcus reniformis]